MGMPVAGSEPSNLTASPSTLIVTPSLAHAANVHTSPSASSTVSSSPPVNIWSSDVPSFVMTAYTGVSLAIV